MDGEESSGRRSVLPRCELKDREAGEREGRDGAAELLAGRVPLTPEAPADGPAIRPAPSVGLTDLMGETTPAVAVDVVEGTWKEKACAMETGIGPDLAPDIFRGGWERDSPALPTRDNEAPSDSWEGAAQELAGGEESTDEESSSLPLQSRWLPPASVCRSGDAAPMLPDEAPPLFPLSDMPPLDFPPLADRLLLTTPPLPVLLCRLLLGAWGREEVEEEDAARW